MTTTRETADHIGEANEKVADHIGNATTMIDHAELARLAEAATLGKWQNGIDDCEGVVAIAEHAGNVICLPPSDDMQASLEFWPRNAAFIAAAQPSTVLALLSEIAALRGDLTVSRDDLDQLQAHFRQRDREATQAERQRDEAVGLLRELADGRSQKNNINEYDDLSVRASTLLANQGADQ